MSYNSYKEVTTMKNFTKRISLALSSVLMASMMVVNASAASATQGAVCAGNSTSTVEYYVAGSGCLSDTDVNALLGKLSSSADSGTANSSSNCQSTTSNCQTTTSAVQGLDTSGSCAAIPEKSSNAAADSTASSCPTVSGSSTSGQCGTLSADLSSILEQFGLNTSNSSTASSVQTPQTTEEDTAASSPEVTETSNSGNSDISSFEQQVVTLVNQQRTALGLAPLTLSSELSNVARTKSQDMSDNNYFSHTSPTYGSPFDMLTSFGISYSSAGENIAMGYQTPEAVVSAWMNSPGHRANILNASYTQIGVGYVSSGNYWTQEFIG
jgi:uncharacterized YkwD family protein